MLNFFTSMQAHARSADKVANMCNRKVIGKIRVEELYFFVLKSALGIRLKELRIAAWFTETFLDDALLSGNVVAILEVMCTLLVIPTITLRIYCIVL